MRGFTFNGTHSSAHGIAMLSKNRQALPAVNDAYMQVSGRHGTQLFPGELSDRVISIECGLAAASPENLRAKMRDIAAWLYTTGRVSLIFDDEPGWSYLAKLEGSIDPKQVSTMSEFGLSFRCEPFAYGAEQQNSFVSDAVTVNNTGTFEALPIFNAVFTATATEWKVTLGTKFVRVVHNFAINDTLEVNCVTGAVLINGARAMDKLDWQNSEFFALAKGNNSLSITPTAKCTATVKHTPRWL